MFYFYSNWCSTPDNENPNPSVCSGTHQWRPNPHFYDFIDTMIKPPLRHSSTFVQKVHDHSRVWHMSAIQLIFSIWAKQTLDPVGPGSSSASSVLCRFCYQVKFFSSPKQLSHCSPLCWVRKKALLQKRAGRQSGAEYISLINDRLPYSQKVSDSSPSWQTVSNVS